MYRRISFLFALAALASACSETTSPDASLNPAQNVSLETGSAEVYRDERTVLIGIQDPAADLRLFIGLPADPRQLPQCGGTEGFDTMLYQEVGLSPEPVQVLARSGDVNVHVYRRSTYLGVCRTTPLAQGTGRLVYTDNDFYGSANPRNNSFGFSLHADVTFTAGGGGAVLARSQIVVGNDGTFNSLVNFIQLSQK